MTSEPLGITPPARHIGAERLGLEPLRIFHAAEMTKVLADPALYVYTGGEPPSFEQLTRRYTMQYAGSRDGREQWHNWVARERATHKAVGFVQATVTPAGADVAWTIGTSWQGRGFATEAAAAMCDWLRSHGVAAIRAWIHVEHLASQRVAAAIGLHATGQIDADGEALWASE